MKTDKQRDTLLGADRATLGEARRDFTDAADLTAWRATPGGCGYHPTPWTAVERHPLPLKVIRVVGRVGGG